MTEKPTDVEQRAKEIIRANTATRTAEAIAQASQEIAESEQESEAEAERDRLRAVQAETLALKLKADAALNDAIRQLVEAANAQVGPRLLAQSADHAAIVAGCASTYERFVPRDDLKQEGLRNGAYSTSGALVAIECGRETYSVTPPSPLGRSLRQQITDATVIRGLASGPAAVPIKPIKTEE